jgi:hypothetical protein
MIDHLIDAGNLRDVILVGGLVALTSGFLAAAAAVYSSRRTFIQRLQGRINRPVRNKECL